MKGRAGRVGYPPVPHEHGAWMMLYVPLVIGLVAFRPAPLPALLLLLAVSGAFGAQNAVGLLLRRSVVRGTAFWLGIYSALLATTGGLLLFIHDLFELVWIGLPAALLFAWQLWLRRTANRRLNSSAVSEVAAIGVFALTAPAAFITARGESGQIAWVVWGACVLYFTSSVFYVRMLVAAARHKEALAAAERWRLGRGLGGYHLLLAGILATLLFRYEGAWPAIVGYAPVLIRALVGWRQLSNELPSLKRVGVKEILYALWFAAWLVVALLAGENLYEIAISRNHGNGRNLILEG